MFVFVSRALLALPLLSAAQLVPTGPAPGQAFKQGAPCPISWTADTSGKWKNTFIELMTGPNDPMIHLSTVANVDGTDPTNTSISIPCPAVSPPAPIYFYQFTAQGQPATWTGRFAISDPSGATSPAPNATQPDGSAVPWGNGKLASPGTPPPPTAPSGQVDASNPGPSSALAQSSIVAAPSSSAAASTPLLTSASSVAAPAPTSDPGINASSAPAVTSTPSADIASPSAVAAPTASTTPSGAAITIALPAAPALVAAAILGLVSLY